MQSRHLVKMRINCLLPLLASAVALMLLTFGANAQTGGSVMFMAKDPVNVTVLDENLAPFQVKDRAGKLTILHFWAMWCLPCVEELPELDQFYGQYKDKGLVVIPVSLDGQNSDKVEAFYEKHGIKHLAINHDNNMEAFRSVGGRLMPLTIIIDSKQQPVAFGQGVVDWKTGKMKELMEKYLK